MLVPRSSLPYLVHVGLRLGPELPRGLVEHPELREPPPLIEEEDSVVLGAVSVRGRTEPQADHLPGPAVNHLQREGIAQAPGEDELQEELPQPLEKRRF